VGHWDELQVEPMPGQPGRYSAALSDVWRLTVALQGGVAAAVGVRAMQALLDDPSQTLRTATTVFAAPVTAGPVEVDVTTVRRGRTMSQLSATVRNAGAPAGLTMVAAFGAARQGFAFTELTPPVVPPADGLRSFRDPLPEGIDFEWDRDPFQFWEHVLQSRPAIGRAPWERWAERPAEVAYWYRFDDPPLTDSGELDVVGLVVMGDTMPGSIGQKVPPVDSPWFAPSVDYTLHVLGEAHPDWLLAHMRARHAGDGYASIDAALWDMHAHPRLVAYATQLCLFSFGG
jgi:acyl-CoA thioesterase